MKITSAILGVALIAMMSGCATQVQKAQVLSAKEIPTGADSKPIQLKKVLVKLRRGEVIGTNHIGLACMPAGEVEWRGGRVNITDEEFTETFREELQKYNYPVVGDPNALFDDPSSWSAELLVAGQISKLQISACYPMAGFGNYRDSKGGAFVRVNWQIYGRLERKVIYEIATEGSFESSNMQSMGIEKNMTAAFALAVQNLLADTKFHSLVLRQSANSEPGRTAQPSMERLLISKATQDSSLSGSRDATITVFAGDGHGSGFVISPDGYAVTNEHVVRMAKFVRVKLANGREVLADVIRSDSTRDVALLKLREQNLPAAVIERKSEPAIGTDVYAIGAPLRSTLDITVSKGIVSAYRDEAGRKYIQSDVQIHPGNSGGPLVLSNGKVVAIAAAGILISGASQNLNFFIPIETALSALNVDFK